MNYYDILFARKMAGGQGEITTEGLSVTENGTYTAPEGKAYTPVVVNVPTPEDTYQLKSLPIGAISTITDGSNLPMPSLKVGIEPQQEGSGDPSPTNIRPISGWNEVDVTRCGKNMFDKANCGVYNGYIAGTQVYSSPSHRTIYFPCKPNTTYSSANFSGNGRNDITYSSEVPRSGLVVPTPLNTITTNENAKYILYYCYNSISDTVTFDDVKNAIDIELGSVVPDTYSAYNGHTYTIDLDGTRYGGKLDVVSGVLTVDRAMVLGGDLTWQKSSAGNKYTTRLQTNLYKWASDIYFICERYKNDGIGNSIMGYYGADGTFRYYYSQGATAISELYVADETCTSLTDFETAIENVKFVYELSTPITYQLNPTAIKSLLGNNNIWADTGDVLEGSYFKEL